jgi:hypothetical protein
MPENPGNVRRDLEECAEAVHRLAVVCAAFAWKKPAVSTGKPSTSFETLSPSAEKCCPLGPLELVPNANANSRAPLNVLATWLWFLRRPFNENL